MLFDVTNPTSFSRQACHLSISIHNLNLDIVSYGLETSKANKGPPFGLRYTVHSLFIYCYSYRLSLIVRRTKLCLFHFSNKLGFNRQGRQKQLIVRRLFTFVPTVGQANGYIIPLIHIFFWSIFSLVIKISSTLTTAKTTTTTLSTTRTTTTKQQKKEKQQNDDDSDNNNRDTQKNARKSICCRYVIKRIRECPW